MKANEFLRNEAVEFIKKAFGYADLVVRASEYGPQKRAIHEQRWSVAKEECEQVVRDLLFVAQARTKADATTRFDQLLQMRAERRGVAEYLKDVHARFETTELSFD